MNAAQTNRARLRELLDRKGVLIAAHRGTSGGAVIQNTALAYENALAHGADILEVDLIRSADGVYYCFHNGQDRLVFARDGDIRELTSREIDRMPLYNSIDHAMQTQRLLRMDEMFERFRGRALINVDRAWDYWEDLLPRLASSDMGEQLILKAAPTEEYLSRLAALAPALMYMPICTRPEDLAAAGLAGVNLAAAELVFDREDDPLLDPEFLQACRSQDIPLWANAITLGDHVTLSAGHDDNGAIREGPDAHWGWLLERGFTIIQTDWPALLDRYRMARSQ